MKRETGWEVIGTALAVAVSVLMVALLSGCRADGTERLRRELEKAVEGVDARVGIAVLSPSGESAAVNGGEDFPMMSVFKLHQALAVCDRLHGSGRSLNETVDIKAEDMAIETYSPLKDRYPNGGISLSVAELTEYTLKKSDNIACDILFDRIVSPEENDAFIREKAGIDGMKIRYNEAEMQADPMRAYENSTTPTAAVRLLERLWKNEILPEEQTAFIKKLMIECETGAAKLPAPAVRNGSPAPSGRSSAPQPAAPESRGVAAGDDHRRQKEQRNLINRLQKESETLLAQIDDTEAELKRLHAEWAREECYSDPQKSAAVAEAVRAAEAEQERLTARWEAVEEELAAARKG